MASETLISKVAIISRLLICEQVILSEHSIQKFEERKRELRKRRGEKQSI
jgi:hypothetical protein